MKTEAQVRRDFAAYFMDLREQNARDGATVSKAHEWRVYVDHLASEGLVPQAASRWKCPKNLEAALRETA